MAISVAGSAVEAVVSMIVKDSDVATIAAACSKLRLHYHLARWAVRPNVAIAAVTECDLVHQ